MAGRDRCGGGRSAVWQSSRDVGNSGATGRRPSGQGQADEEESAAFSDEEFSLYHSGGAKSTIGGAAILEDYEAHFVHGRYFGAALPRLPFFDRTFHVVLCAHLLFIHAAQFDYAFHLAAGRELVRVRDMKCEFIQCVARMESLTLSLIGYVRIWKWWGLPRRCGRLTMSFLSERTVCSC